MKLSSRVLLMPLLMVSCSHQESPLLKGAVATNDSVMVTAYYDIDGDTYFDEFFTDSLGCFTYNPSIPKGTDLSLSINGRTYGVRIENGASVNLTIDSVGEASFEGDNVAESRWLNACFSGYDPLRYKHVVIRDGAYCPDKYMSMAETARKATESILPEVKDDSLRAYYGRLGELMHKRTRAKILSYDYEMNLRESGAEYPAEIKTLKMIDPNDDASRAAGALHEWSLSFNAPVDGGLVKMITAICDRVDANVTNHANRRAIFNSLSEIVFGFDMPAGDLQRFVNDMAPRISAHQLKLLNERIAEIEHRTKDGDRIPCDPVLVRPDGSKTTLSESCAGKVAYIDMWATWCGPCCAQIPYMEKIAGYYKNNGKVVCISISCDEDLDAWHRKLDQDNPEWPQYVFSGESGQEFMTAMGVTGIPRFIILNPDLTIAMIDAPRPQKADDVKTIIDTLISK